MELVTLSRVFILVEADLMATRLESAGFTPFIHGVAAALSSDGYSMGAGGIQVKVPADQAQREFCTNYRTNCNSYTITLLPGVFCHWETQALNRSAACVKELSKPITEGKSSFLAQASICSNI